VAVLVLNWNGRHHLEACLPSLLRTTYSAVQLTVVDNGSTDGSLAWLASEYPTVEALPLARNLGFAAGNNRGLEHAARSGARYAVLLNNDTRVEPDWLDALVEAAESHPLAALCASQQRNWGGTRELHFRYVPAWAEAELVQTSVGPTGAPARTVFASGCALLVRLSALQDLGAFDERYYCYVEDVDLSLRACIQGYEVLTVPASIVYHRFTGSDSPSPQRMYWGYRNQLTTLLKLYEHETWEAYWPQIRTRWFATRNRVALRGTAASLAWLPGTLARRAQIQRVRRRHDAEFLDMGNT